MPRHVKRLVYRGMTSTLPAQQHHKNYIPEKAMDSVSLSLVAFTAAATVLTITPGLDTALVLRTAFVGNARGAAFAGLGIAVGCFCWASLIAHGLGALLAASHVAYTVLRWIGAAYLVWTGYKML